MCETVCEAADDGKSKPNVERLLSNPRWRADGANHPARRRVTMSTSMRANVSARPKVTPGARRPSSDGAPSRRAVAPPRASATSDDHVTGTRTAPVLPPASRAAPLPESILTRRHLLQSSLGAALLAAFDLAPATEPALALYNKDLDDPITDPVQALAVVFAVRASVRDVIEQIALFEDTCPAPVFPCDLSQLSTKTSTRISGPLKRCLPTLSETYGADPYAVQDILQSTSTCEAMLYANNARVKVDFKGPATFLNLVDDSIAALLTEIPEDALAAGKARFEACDLTVDPTAEGDLECRLGRAVASGARPTGGIG